MLGATRDQSAEQEEVADAGDDGAPLIVDSATPHPGSRTNEQLDDDGPGHSELDSVEARSTYVLLQRKRGISVLIKSVNLLDHSLRA